MAIEPPYAAPFMFALVFLEAFFSSSLTFIFKFNAVLDISAWREEGDTEKAVLVRTLLLCVGANATALAATIATRRNWMNRVVIIVNLGCGCKSGMWLRRIFMIRMTMNSLVISIIVRGARSCF